jgi:putative peptide zinc metalloprotease protein
MSDAALPSPMLPPLREDLSLSRGPLAGGVPTWTIYDPSRHRFLRLEWLDFEILSRWRLRTPDAILRSLAGETTLHATEDDVVRFAEFARQAGLLRPISSADTARLAGAGAQRPSAFTWLIHNYLFLRIRLVDPDRFLGALLPLVRGLYSRAGVVLIVLLGVLGLFLISREWEAYTHSLVEQYTMEGLLGMGVAISIAKVFHELGHGFAAKRFGCRVPSMGVAFLVLWPVLWTDTTDAWRLADRRQRLVIDVSGMAAEIAIAALASIAWAALPDGPARSAMFVLSSSTWLLTLFINLSPLMRFDGYYILSDLLDVANLQERGFAYARWSLRELLFRPRLPPPEQPGARLARIFVVYSLASWIYRFFLFTGIALLVYHVTFKALGLVLAAIELWFFVARPILKEVALWPRLLVRGRLNGHTLVTLGLVALLLALLFVPWRGRLDAPALLRADKQATLLAAEAGRLAQMVPRNALVAEGSVLFRLESVEIDHDREVARAQLEAAQAGLSTGTFDPDRRRAQQASYARVSEAAAALSRADSRAESLLIRAPFAGEIRDIPPNLRIGDDLKRSEPLGVLVALGPPIVEAYVAEADLDRVAKGAKATFIPVDGETLPFMVAEVARTSTRTLDVPELSSTHDGPVAVRRTSSGSFVPDRALYRVVLTGAAPLAPPTIRTAGHVVIEAPARSAADLVYRRALALVLRESSM